MSEHPFIDALEHEMQGAVTDMRREMNRGVPPGPLPHVSRLTRLRWAVRHKVHEGRTSLAQRIAPWLGDDHY